MTRLSEYSGSGRDNNFNLLRFIAASLVLVTHSFALSAGSAAAEPMRTSLGFTWGMLAVDVFFVISGFLVTGSLLFRKSVREFAVARFLRIYPGLWVALALTVFVAAAGASMLGASEFLARGETWLYLVKNASTLRVHYYLPGVFEGGAVNGSLWTLPIEVKMYVALAIAWLLATRLPSPPAQAFAKICVGVAAALGLLYLFLLCVSPPYEGHWVRLAFMFFCGSAFRLMQDRVLLSLRVATALAVATLVSAMDRALFSVVYAFSIAYVALYLAFVPGGAIRRFNQLGDYSYGIYIYAFPVQQMILFLWPGMGPYELMLASFLVTLAFAIASWEFVEKPALGLKHRFSGGVREQGMPRSSSLPA